MVVVVDRKELSGEMWSQTRRLICWNLEKSGGERAKWECETLERRQPPAATSWHGTFMENGRGVSIIRCNATQLIKNRRDGPSVITTLDRLSSELARKLCWNWRANFARNVGRWAVTNTQAAVLHVKSGSTFLKWAFLLLLRAPHIPFARTKISTLGYRGGGSAGERKFERPDQRLLSLALFLFLIATISRASAASSEGQ